MEMIVHIFFQKRFKFFFLTLKIFAAFFLNFFARILKIRHQKGLLLVLGDIPGMFFLSLSN
jgi:hypothetical protein